MPPQYTYFKQEEIVGLNEDLVAKLDLARGKSGVPFKITSGKRSVEDNSDAAGVQDSAHLSGEAVDLECLASQDRFKMLSALLAVGFTRIGIYSKHCHVDVDATKDQNVIWFGGESH